MNCRQNPANVYLKQSVNGVSQEGLFCSACAKEMRIDVNPLFNLWSVFGSMVARPKAAASTPQELSLADESIRKNQEIDMLSKELKKAVEVQDFRKAAKLKKEIDKLNEK